MRKPSKSMLLASQWVRDLESLISEMMQAPHRERSSVVKLLRAGYVEANFGGSKLWEDHGTGCPNLDRADVYLALANDFALESGLAREDHGDIQRSIENRA